MKENLFEYSGIEKIIGINDTLKNREFLGIPANCIILPSPNKNS